MSDRISPTKASAAPIAQATCHEYTSANVVTSVHAGLSANSATGISAARSCIRRDPCAPGGTSRRASACMRPTAIPPPSALKAFAA